MMSDWNGNGIKYCVCTHTENGATFKSEGAAPPFAFEWHEKLLHHYFFFLPPIFNSQPGGKGGGVFDR